MPHLKRESARIFYQSSGTQGPWVTLVNGHTRTHKDFAMMRKHLEGEGFRTLTLDNRGSGQTEDFSPFTIADMADDVRALWNELKIDRSHLLGISMGGGISQIIAAEDHRVDKLVLVSTSSFHQHTPPDQPWGATLSSVDDKLKTYVSEEFYRKNRLLIQAMAKQISSQIEDGDFTAQSTKQRNAMDGFDGLPYLKKISCLSLIIHGQEDQIVPVQEAIFLNQEIKESRLELLDGIGHLLLAECPKDLYRQVAEFLHGS